MTPPKLALFLPDLSGGGAERVMVNLANGFCERGIRTDLVLINAAGPYLDMVVPEVRVIELGTRRSVLSPPALARYLRRERPTALISALEHANVAALYAKKLSGTSVRTVVTIHNTLSVHMQQNPSRKVKFLSWLVRTAYSGADAIVAVSNEAADDFSAVTGIARERVITIYNPIVSDDLLQRAQEPLEHPWFLAGEPPVVLGIGRLTPQKDFATLIRAFALLRERMPARLMILGEGEERHDLEALVTELGLVDHVLLPGFVNNPYAYLKRASVFVLSSRWEGLPTVLIEALALGLPIVSTDCRSGPREILEDGRYGQLVEVSNSAVLADALAHALEDERQVKPREAWQKFTDSVSVDAYLRVGGVAVHV